MSDIASLSPLGVEFLSNKVMYEALSAIAASVGVTAREYLERFERALSERPDEIFNAIDRCKQKEPSCF